MRYIAALAVVVIGSFLAFCWRYKASVLIIAASLYGIYYARRVMPLYAPVIICYFVIEAIKAVRGRG